MKSGGTREGVWDARFNRAAIGSFVVAGVLYGGAKTNGVNNLPPQMQQGGGSFLQLQLETPTRTPVQQTFAERKQANWNVRGAWKDSFWLDFDGGWVFPHGTNHLAGVEVVSFGQVWATPFDTNAVASAGEPFEIVPGLTTFAQERTPSNSYRFAWTDAAPNRDTNALVSAALELFRNGDVAVTTNGVTTTRPRVLPFPHNGFGQDAEWVAANFTNATEILAVGYPNWVDAQVGEGLTNGLYKLTVTVAEDPPETTRLGVGGLSVAVTNAGEYVFLLEKGLDYPLAVFPSDFTNAVYSAVDDVPQTRGAPGGLRGGGSGETGGQWTEDFGNLEILVPVYPLVPGSQAAHVRWKPWLRVSPVNWQPSLLAPDETFAALLTDVPWWRSPSYRWFTADPTVVSVAAPTAPATEMTAHAFGESLQAANLSLEVTLGGCVLHSYFAQGAASDGILSVSAPNVLFVNDDDDNENGEVDVSGTAFSLDDDIVAGRIQLHSPVPTNGTVVVEGIYGYEEGFFDKGLVFADSGCTDEIREGREFTVFRSMNWFQTLYFNPGGVSSSCPGVQIKVRWRPQSGPAQTASAFTTIVSPVAEPVCNATTNVVEGGVAHSYTVNPSGVVVGREAYFRVEVASEELPDELVVWEKTGGVEFVGSCTGRAVTVRGTAAGDATLAIRVGDCRSSAPTFAVEVVENTTVDLRAWIIKDRDGATALTTNDIRQMVKAANDIYAQVGVTLNLVEPIVVTNIPDAYDAFYGQPTNTISNWTYRDIVDMHSGTGGLECYFINRFVNDSAMLAVNGPRGMVVTRAADYLDFAHEIGHAFNMEDIYISNSRSKKINEPLLALQPTDKACATHMADDWNGGCTGLGLGGTRYYRSGTSMSDILSRMLMNGVREVGDGQRDITIGSIYGVYYTYDENYRKVWHKGNAAVGFPWNNRNPTHE